MPLHDQETIPAAIETQLDAQSNSHGVAVPESVLVATPPVDVDLISTLATSASFDDVTLEARVFQAVAVIWLVHTGCPQH